MERRRRIRIVAAISLTIVAAVSAFAGLHVGAETGERSEPGEWSLRGVKDGGRTLVVRGPTYGGCDRAAVRADDSHGDRVVITSQVLTPRGRGLICTSDIRGGDEFELRLDRPIAGRAVTGERRDPGRPFLAARDVDIKQYIDRDGALVRTLPAPDRKPPNVVGLRFRDARHALCHAGFEARRPPGDVRSGVVVAQRAPVRQRMTGRPRDPTCRNGMLAAVDLTVRAR